MKTSKLTAIRELIITEEPTPVIKHDTDVLLKMDTTGVCGSDVHYYTTGRIGTQIVEFPFTVGHETCAVVAEVGSAVTSVKPGDRVIVEPAVSCGKCDQCLQGRHHTCRKLVFLGCPGQIPGCLSEYMVMPERCCFHVPENMTMTQAALVEPLSIGYYGCQLFGDLTGKNIGILGMGPIGTSVMLCAKAKNVNACYVTDKLDYRLKIAESQSVAYAGNPDNTDVVEDINQACPMLLDAVFECSGSQEAFTQAFHLLKPGGKLLQIGIPEFADFSFPAEVGRRSEICIQNVRRQNHCVRPVIDLLKSGAVKANFMVTHTFGFAETQQAFDLVSSYGDGVLKAIIKH